MCPPQRVPDHSAAAQVINMKAQMMVPVVRLKQCVIGKGAKELEMNTDIYHIIL